MDTFKIDAYPVTNRAYARFLEETGYPASAINSTFQISSNEHTGDSEELAALATILAKAQRRGFSEEKAQARPDHPVVEVSWYDAVEFCRWANKRLPTAEEWEKAARGTEGREWSWGNGPDASRGNTREAGFGEPTPVRQYEQWPSPFGCFDMSGNVMEWTATPAGDPSAAADRYVIKGGCWAFAIEEARAWKQHDDPPDDLWNALGFRGCVRTRAERQADIASPELGPMHEDAGVVVAYLLAAAKSGEGTNAEGIVGVLSEHFDAAARASAIRRLSLVIDVGDDDGDDVRTLRAIADLAVATAHTVENDPVVLLHAERTHGCVLAIEGDLSGSIDVLTRCVERCRCLDSQETELGRTLLSLARVESKRNLTMGAEAMDARSAHAHLTDAVRIFRRHRLYAAEQAALACLAGVHRLLGELDVAFSIARRALAGSLACEDDLGEAKAVLAVGEIFLDLRALELAAYCFKTAHRLASRYGDPSMATRAHLRMFLTATWQSPALAASSGAEAFEAVVLTAPEYLDQFLNVVASRGRDPMLAWALGSYLGNLAALSGAPARLPLAASAECAIACALGAPDVVQRLTPTLSSLAEQSYPPPEDALVHGILAMALRTEHPDAALRRIDHAVESADSAELGALAICMRQMRVEVLKSARRWEEAVVELRTLRPLFEQIGNLPLLVAHREYEALVLFWAGDVSAALTACDAATIAGKELRGLGEDARVQGRVGLLRADIFAAVGSWKALLETESARWSFVAGHDRLGAIRALVVQSRIILSNPDHHAILTGKAGEYLQHAQALLNGHTAGLRDERLECDFLHAAACFYHAHGDAQRSGGSLEAAGELAARIGYEDGETMSAITALAHALDRGEHPERREIDQVVRTVLQRRRPLEMVHGLLLAARAYADRSEWREARDQFAAALAMYHRVRETIGAPLLRKEWLERQRSLFEHFVYMLLRGGAIEEALQVARQTKAATLEDLLSEARTITGGDLPPPEAERLRKTYQEIRRKEIELERLVGLAGVEDTEYEQRVELYRLRETLDALLQGRATAAPRETALEPMDVWSVLGTAPHVAVVELFLTEQGTVVFVLAPNRATPTVIELSHPTRRELRETLQAVLEDLPVPDQRLPSKTGWQMESFLSELGATVFGTPSKDGMTLLDVLRAGGAEKLVIIPSGALALVPLHAVPCGEGDERIIDEFIEVTYAPNIQMLIRSSERRRDLRYTPERVFAAQNPDDSLRHAESEVRHLRSFFRSATVLAREDATKQRVIAALEDAELIHFACHARFDQGTPYDSGLCLADGVLSVAELYMSLRLPSAPLVTLGACDTARVDLRLADEFLNISSGFFHAGAAGVISTLWRVHDLASMLLMVRLYQELAAGVPAAQALAAAQRWLRDVTASELARLLDRTQSDGLFDEATVIALSDEVAAARSPDQRPFLHPAYWAPFTYVGF